MHWDEPTSKWVVRIRRPSATDPSTYEEFEDRADVVLNGTGGLSRWKWPDIEGFHEFKGKIVHSAGWDFGGERWEDEVKDWGDKNVAVIGLVRPILFWNNNFLRSTLICILWQGSSALQIVSALQPKVGKLYNVARGQAWVAPPFAVQKISELLGRELDPSNPSNCEFVAELPLFNEMES